MFNKSDSSVEALAELLQEYKRSELLPGIYELEADYADGLLTGVTEVANPLISTDERFPVLKFKEMVNGRLVTLAGIAEASDAFRRVLLSHVQARLSFPSK